MLVLSRGKGALLTEISQPAAPRAGASSREGQAWKGRREEEEKQQLGSLPRAKDAAFPRADFTEARWMPSLGRSRVFATIYWVLRLRFSWDVWVVQAPRPTCEPVSALPEPASAQERSPWGYKNVLDL